MADSFMLKAILTAVDKMSPALKNIRNGVKAVHKSLHDIGSAGGQLMSKIGIPAGLAFLGISASVKEAVSSLLDYGGALKDASDRTGMSVEMLQALRWSAGQAGVDAAALDASMVKLNKSLAEGASGDASLQGLFQQMRVPLRDVNGQVRALGDVLPEIAESFKNTENPAVRTRMAMALFGKEGTKLVPMLAEGRAGISRLMAEADRLGISLSGGAVDSLDSLGDSLFTVSTQLRAQMGTALARAVENLRPLIDSLSEWIGKNKELIQSKVSDVIREVATWVKSVDWQKVGADIAGVVRMVVGFVEAMGGIKTLVVGIGLAFAAGPLASIMQIGMAVGRLGASLFSLAAANPVVLGIVAAVAALVVIGGLLMAYWDDIGPVIMGVLEPVGQAFGALWDAFKGLMQALSPLLPILKFVAGVLGLALLGAVMVLSKAVERLVGFFTSLFKVASSVINFIGDKVGAIGSFFGLGGGAGGGGPSLVTPAAAGVGGRQSVEGQVNVNFLNAPPGMRVESSSSSSSFGINTDAGYRTDYLGSAM